MPKSMTKAQELEQLASEALAGSEAALSECLWKMAQYAINGPTSRPDLNAYPSIVELVSGLALNVEAA